SAPAHFVQTVEELEYFGLPELERYFALIRADDTCAGIRRLTRPKERRPRRAESFAERAERHLFHFREGAKLDQFAGQLGDPRGSSRSGLRERHLGIVEE